MHFIRIEAQDTNEQLQKAKLETDILKSHLSKSSELEYTGTHDDHTIKNLEFSDDALSTARTVHQPDFPELIQVGTS